MAEIRNGIEERLKSITGLRVHRYLPEKLLTPAALIMPDNGQYSATMDAGSHDKAFVIQLVASKASSRTGQELLDSFVEEDGDNSIFAAFEDDDTLGGAADWSRVVGWRDYGGYTISGEEYIGVVFDLEVCSGR